MNNEAKMSMFYPKTKGSLLLDYPELSKLESLKKLNKEELLFVWYYACEASPFNNEEDDGEKIRLSVDRAFGRIQNRVMGSYISKSYSEKVKQAIVSMRMFKIGPRIRSKLMIEKIMTNYEELINIDPKVDFLDKDKNEDWTKKKAYIDSCAKIASTLPSLISQSEGSFGIVELEEGDSIDIDMSEVIEDYHENNS